MNLLNYGPNKKIHWLGNIDQLKILISELITDLLKNVLLKDSAIPNADASNCSSETNSVDHDVNGVLCIDGYNPKD